MTTLMRPQDRAGPQRPVTSPPPFLPRFLAGALLVLLGVSAAPADDPSKPAPPPPAPRIIFDVKEINFGKVVVGEVVERVFKFRNAGTATLLVRRVKPSCGCTAALLSKEEVAPGESGEIKVRFDSGDRQGEQNHEVQVFSNDAAEKDMGENVSVLKLRGVVANLLDVMPMSFYFPAFLRGSPNERKVTVLPADVQEVKALAVEASKPYLKTSVRPFARSGKKGFEIGLEIAPDAPFGPIDERITVKTDHPRQPALRIPIFGRLHGKIVCFPDRLLLLMSDGEAPGASSGEIGRGGNEPLIHFMRVAGEGGIPIEAIETPPLFEAETTEVIPGKRLEVRLKLKPGAPRGPFAGGLRIFLRDAEQPLFEVPVAGEVLRRVTVDPPGAWLEAGAAGTALLRVRGAKVLGATPAAGTPVTAALEGEGLVRLRIAPDAAPGPFAGAVRLETDAPGEEEVAVPVRGIAPGAHPAGG